MACMVHERPRGYVCRRITSPAENTTKVIFAIRCLAADRSTEIPLMFEHEFHRHTRVSPSCASVFALAITTMNVRERRGIILKFLSRSFVTFTDPDERAQERNLRNVRHVKTPGT